MDHEYRYGQFTYNVEAEHFQVMDMLIPCEQELEVLIISEDGEPQWVKTCVGYDDGWYLEGLAQYQMNGLFCRWEKDCTIEDGPGLDLFIFG